MEELKHLVSSRRGFRTHLKKLISKVQEINEQHSDDPSLELDPVDLADLRDQLKRKRDILADLDKKILPLLTSEEEVEREVVDSEEYNSTISTSLARITRLLEVCTTKSPPTVHPLPPPPSTATSEESSAEHSRDAHPPTLRAQDITRLPKLSIPSFSGNILEWQSFWDCFDSAVHNNPMLSGVQKLNYLRAQLQGGALRIIAGLPLTTPNYNHSVALLKERYGQSHKLIDANMKALIELPSPSNSISSLQMFYDTVATHTRSLTALGKPTSEYGAMLVTSMLNKLPVETRRNLARAHGTDQWTIDELQHAILEEIRILEMGTSNTTKSSQLPTASFLTNADRRSVFTPRTRNPAEQKSPALNCAYCHGPHTSISCDTVKDPQRRLEIVKHDRLCFNCLGHHQVSQCKSRSRCRTCHRKHHTSLCYSANGSLETNTPPAGTSANLASNSATATSTTTGNVPARNAHSQAVNTHPPTVSAQVAHPQATLTTLSSHHPVTIPQNGRISLLKTAIATVSSPRTEAEANVLFDEGSQRSFLTSNLADLLGLQSSHREDIHLASFGAKTPTSQQLEVASVNLKTRTGALVPLSVLIVPDIAVPLTNTINREVTQLPYLNGLPLAHPVTSDEHFNISLLIGVDHYWDIVDDNIIRGDGPTAMGSKLGYLLSGPLPVSHSEYGITNTLHVGIVSDVSCNLEKFWTLETTGTEPASVSEDREFLERYSKTCITRLSDGSYCARFPWKEVHLPLPSNFDVCLHRTRSLARRLAQTPGFLKLYNSVIMDQLQRGFIEQIGTPTLTRNVHYIPHHCVKKNSTTTPIRVVYDCSCRQSKETPSLNDCLLQGPDFLNDLCSILLRFRTHTFAISTDIEKAFLQVHLHEQDRDFTRFLWLADPTDAESELVTYRFRTVLFGAVSSPFILYATLYHHLQQYDTPLSYDIQHNLYVDNIVSGSPTELEAVQYYHDSRAILSSAGFNLRAWTSNSHRLRAVAEQDATLDQTTPSNVLGIHWNTATDMISLTPKQTTRVSNALTTKREVLQESSRIFDPIGFAVPVTIRSKLLMQKLWKMKTEWDEPLEPTLISEWQSIVEDVNQLSNMSLNRRYAPTNFDPAQVELHTFTDASTKAYGTVTFVNIRGCVSYVMAKSRVAPVKATTLPRLELMAAVTGARLTSFVVSALQLEPVGTYIWTDSQIVLYWLNSSKKLPPFVDHRVQEIHRLTPTASWRYCPTGDNPADLLTRGISFNQLATSQLWTNGPEWLPDPTQWPKWEQSPSIHLMALAGIAEDFVPRSDPKPPSTGLHCAIVMSKYSTLHKLLAVTAYIYRFVFNCRHPQTQRKGPLLAQELREAQLNWISDCQKEVYWRERHNLSCPEPRQKRLVLIRQLRLFLDSAGFIRCGGRIHNAPLDEITRFPYLLPAKHPLTALIIYAIHVKQCHSGIISTVTALRQTYWVPTARQYVKTLLYRCTICKKHNGKPYKQPDPAPLPKARMQAVPPFTATGVDFTGALYVRRGNEEIKVYVCLFTCATSRAVHLEVVADLSTEAFMLAFRRFVSRRSLPQLMMSDNALTYEAAAEELKELFNSDEVLASLERQGTTWKFIPKRAPWFGGFWERLIGLTKAAIKKTLGRTHVSLEVLQTIVVEVELILNNRPITYLSDDIRDPEPLTPAHLLHGRSLTSLPHQFVVAEDIQDPSYDEKTRLTKAARSQSLLLKHFTSRWKHEYLTSLRDFHRTSGNNCQQVKTGDVVLIHDDGPRLRWKMAVIEELIVGGDGLVRAANIRTSSGRTNRPIAKLYPLEVASTTEDNSDQLPQDHDNDDRSEEDTPVTSRPVRSSAREARLKVSQWADTLLAPPEDVED